MTDKNNSDSENLIKTEISEASKECSKDDLQLITGNTDNGNSKTSSETNVSENIRYENDKCIYKDPDTNVEYLWNESKNSWELKQSSKSGDTNYCFDGQTYKYVDKESNKRYVWNADKNSWQEDTDKDVKPISNKDTNPAENEDNDEENEEEDDEQQDESSKLNKNRKQLIHQDMTKGYYGCDGDTHTYTDPTDGTVYFWDKEKSAWFPKIDDTFMAYYQMSYGFNESSNASADSEMKIEKNDEDKITKAEKISETDSAIPSAKRKAPQPTNWFEPDEKQNTKVYVDNLPLDITEQEFVDLMQKCGLVMRDIDTGKMKVKLYTEPDGKQLKGDALCTYIKRESVDLALQLLDGYSYKGRTLKVELAKFTMKGAAYDPSLKPKTKRRKDKEKMKKAQERLFDWRPDKLRGERSKHECVVVVKNLFDPKIFDDDLGLIIEYRQDIRDECSKCGAVRKVVMYDKHPEGVAQIWFKEAEAADACIALLNNRWFGQRQITAAAWDGKTKYKISETKEETAARLKKWEDYLTANKSNENKSNENIGNENKGNDDKQANSESSSKLEITQPTAADTADSDGTRSSAGSEDETDEEKG